MLFKDVQLVKLHTAFYLKNVDNRKRTYSCQVHFRFQRKDLAENCKFEIHTLISFSK